MYQTPLWECYNGQELFPGDNSWGAFDIMDIPMGNSKDVASFQRNFFASQNGTCLGDPTDRFVLPTHACVGPFGPPRPWGNFTFVAVVDVISSFSKENYRARVSTAG